MRYLYNQHQKDDKNFRPDWRKGKIVERNGNNTGYIIVDDVGGLHNRIDEDCEIGDME